MLLYLLYITVLKAKKDYPYTHFSVGIMMSVVMVTAHPWSEKQRDLLCWTNTDCLLLTSPVLDMGNVYYVNKTLGLGLLVAAAAALATIIALSVAYNNEKSKNRGTGAASTASTSTPPVTSFTPKDPWDYYRLPSSLLPLSYNVTLWPRLEPDADGMYIFTGHSVVIFTCLKNTDLVIIHSTKLNLTTFSEHHAKLTGLNGASPPAIERSWFVDRTEYLVLQLRGQLSVGASYALYTEFRGELADDLQGFYRSEYTEDGVKK